MQADSGGRILPVDILRGLSALSVACFHLTHSGDYLPRMPVITWLLGYSGLGLYVFFVISGFVLPWSLHRSGYTIHRYGKFIAKRVVRLDPPYLLSAVLVLALNYASSLAPGFGGKDAFIGWPAVFGHIAFLNVITGAAWLNPVFWTLAIEFQYYLLIGLLFPLVASASRAVRMLTTAAFLAAPYLGIRGAYLPKHACLFLLGIAAFQLRSRVESRVVFFTVWAAATAALFNTSGPAVATASSAAALLIALAPARAAVFTWKPLLALGSVSYSLYLVHVPIGGRVVNLAHRLPQTPVTQFAEATIALGISVIAAHLLYRLVEKPSRELAARIPWENAGDGEGAA